MVDRAEEGAARGYENDDAAQRSLLDGPLPKAAATATPAAFTVTESMAALATPPRPRNPPLHQRWP